MIPATSNVPLIVSSSSRALRAASRFACACASFCQPPRWVSNLGLQVAGVPSYASLQAGSASLQAGRPVPTLRNCPQHLRQHHLCHGVLACAPILVPLQHHPLAASCLASSSLLHFLAELYLPLARSGCLPVRLISHEYPPIYDNDNMNRINRRHYA